MRTVLFLLAGFLLLAAFYALARLFSEHYPGASNVALISYVVLWLVMAAFNMWVGVAKAGYSAAEELPIFLVIFGVPVAMAVVAKWKFL
jgi:hypothetical protein